MSLKDFLSNLNSGEHNWKIWVNPDLPEEEYRAVQEPGRIDGWVCVGSLEGLSFGFQSKKDAFLDCIDLVMQGKARHYNPSALFDAYYNGDLPLDLSREIDREIESIHKEWSQFEAEEFVVDKLPAIIAEYKELLET